MKAYSLLIIENEASRGAVVLQLPDATTDLEALQIIFAAVPHFTARLGTGVELVVTGPAPDFATICNYKEAT